MIKTLIPAVFLALSSLAHGYDAIEHQRDQIISDFPAPIDDAENQESTRCARVKTPEEESTEDEIIRESSTGEVRRIPNYPEDCPSTYNQRYEA